MAKTQRNRTTAASILQISFSRITKCANKDSFHRDSHIYFTNHNAAAFLQNLYHNIRIPCMGNIEVCLQELYYHTYVSVISK